MGETPSDQGTEYSRRETAERADAALRVALNTPPKPHAESKIRKPNRKRTRSPSNSRRFRQAKKRLAICFRVRALVSRPVRETLALCAFDGARRTFSIVHAKLGAVGIAEIEFREITVQMGL